MANRLKTATYSRRLESVAEQRPAPGYVVVDYEISDDGALITYWQRSVEPVTVDN